MSVAVLSVVHHAGTLAAFIQVGGMSEEGMRAMGTGMMVVCVLFGLLLFAALTEFVILEFLWIKVWSQRLHNEFRPTPAIGGRAA